MSVVIAVDAGTTGVRAFALRDDGTAAGFSYQEFTQHFPRPGWVEHDPTEIWTAVQTTLAALVGELDEPVAAIGITDQRETVVAWDRRTGATAASRHRLAGPPHGEPLRRAPRRGRRAARAGHHRPRARPVLQRHQGGVAPHRGRRGGHARPGHRHRRRLGPVEPHRRHRRRCARHRAVERQPHHALRHPHAGLVRRAPRPLRGPRGGPPRGSAVERSLRGHGERDGRARRASRCPASPGTSRPPSSARPASNPA